MKYKYYLPVVCALLLGSLMGCESLSYYGQAVNGQWSMIRKRQDIEQLVDHAETGAQLKARLQKVLEIRDFAEQHLQLPVADAYSHYVDVGSDFVVWNVFAAPELSLRAEQWCFPVAGCVSYRGYFSRQDALDKARSLKESGLEVHVGGVKAYSTLGWFADPVLNTFVWKNDVELGALLFHELAHRQFYVKGDTAFNESFATAVEQAGLRLWLQAADRQQDMDKYHAKRQQRQQVIDLVMHYRQLLSDVYTDEALTEQMKRRSKRQLLDELNHQYQLQKAEQGWDSRYDQWISTMNNAKLAAVGSYHQYVDYFNRLLEQKQGDLPAFYQAVAELADSTTVETRKKLLQNQP